MAGSGRRNGDTGLLMALASGQAVADAAKQAGVSERTAFRRLQDPAFQRQLSELRGQMQSRAVGLLAELAINAAATLGLLLKAEAESVRLGAARAILDLGSRLREQSELEMRLAALEQIVEARGEQKQRSQQAS